MRLVCATALLFGVLAVTSCESSDEGGPQAVAGGSGAAGSSSKGAGKGSGEPCVDICYGTREYCEGGAIYSCSASPENPCVRVYEMLEECEYGCDAAGQSCAGMPLPGAAGAPASGGAAGASPSGGAAGAEPGAGAGGLAGADAGGASGAGAEAGSSGSGGA